MQTTHSNPPLISKEFRELNQFFQYVEAPYTEHDARAFNALLRCLYPRLSPVEKRRAGFLADALNLLAL
jgi:hypothetical protein